MRYRLKLSKIPFFQYLTPMTARKIAPLFRIVTHQKGEDIITFGNEVPGLFIIAQGSVEIFTEERKTRLATLSPGAIFGEMSLIENQLASATVAAASDNTRLLLCGKQAFHNVIHDDFVFAAAFYKGASKLLSERLRLTNAKIELELAKSRDLLNEMMKQDGILDKIGHARGQVNDTGESVLEDLAGVLPQIKQIEQKAPEHAHAIQEIYQAVETVVLIHSQNFDIISQQLDLIRQYIQNVHNLLAGREISEVQGDTNVFSVSTENTGETEITFF